MKKTPLTELQKRPLFHLEKIQGVTTAEPYQEDILLAIAKHDRVVISACHDIGKTWILAKAVLWLGSCFPGAKIITTAPTFLQVEKLLWSEIRAGYRKTKFHLGGTLLNTAWNIEDDWFCFGMSPKEDAGASDRQGSDSRFQGVHGALTVIVFDEATGVGPKRWIQVEGMLTSANVKFIGIGNPTTKQCDFARCFQSPMYKKISLSCFDSPNLKVNNVTDFAALEKEVIYVKQLPEDERLDRIANYKVIQPKLLTLSWVVGGALKWGFSHPLFLSKALGKFPDEDENACIPLWVVEEAQRRKGDNSKPIRAIGVDPARFGADSTVITVIEGNRQTIRKELVKADTAQTTGEIVRLINSLPRKTREIVSIDATGLGAGVVDQLIERRRDKVIPDMIEIREIHFGAMCPRDDDKLNYTNLKAKLFMQLSEDLKTDLSIIGDGVYLEELPAILYKFDSRGRYVIESKDDYKKRTGLSSPDSADSLAIANYGRHSIHALGNFSSNMASSDFKNTSTIVNKGFDGGW